MNPADLIQRKLGGNALTTEQLDQFIAGLAGDWRDAQLGAMSAAMFANGLDRAETEHLVAAMVASGECLQWDLPGPVLDKHSTGGLGDTVSLMLAPVLAAAGAFVPMISGRALGHTGGTLDKLEAIPGVSTDVDIDRFRRLVAEHGFAIVSQSPTLVPADARWYALRDTTGTVACRGMIVASILSKKIAAGVEHLVLDIKIGRGGFVADLAAGRELARAMQSAAAANGLKLSVVFSDMSAPLGRCIGHGLEVLEAIEWLSGDVREPRTTALIGELATALVGESAVVDALASDEPLQRFAGLWHAMGAPADLIERPHEHLPRAPHSEVIEAPADGFAAMLAPNLIADLIQALGARPDAKNWHPGAGISELCTPGAAVVKGEPLLTLHGADASGLDRARQLIAEALPWAEQTGPRSVVLSRWPAQP